MFKYLLQEKFIYSNLVDIFCMCKRSLCEYITMFERKHSYALLCKRMSIEFSSTVETLKWAYKHVYASNTFIQFRIIKRFEIKCKLE